MYKNVSVSITILLESKGEEKKKKKIREKRGKKSKFREGKKNLKLEREKKVIRKEESGYYKTCANIHIYLYMHIQTYTHNCELVYETSIYILL